MTASQLFTLNVYTNMYRWHSDQLSMTNHNIYLKIILRLVFDILLSTVLEASLKLGCESFCLLIFSALYVFSVLTVKC